MFNFGVRLVCVCVCVCERARACVRTCVLMRMGACRCVWACVFIKLTWQTTQHLRSGHWNVIYLAHTTRRFFLCSSKSVGTAEKADVTRIVALVSEWRSCLSLPLVKHMRPRSTRNYWSQRFWTQSPFIFLLSIHPVSVRKWNDQTRAD